MGNGRKIKTLSYRGSLKSCNYRCHYCPFSKNPKSERQLVKDRAALERFCRETEQYEDIGVMFLPYGEALIHDYYLQQIARLTRRSGVQFVACQTNLSFNIDHLSEYEIDVSKLKLWCSFHPTQTSVTDFVRQCEKLAQHNISFCVGAVGDTEALPVIRELRARLDPSVYLWINDMDGKPEPYSREIVQAFTDIDPLFELELSYLPADTDKCRAGQDSFFINENGDVFACNISREPMGNIYRQSLARMNVRGCKARACSCYLAYSNRKDLNRLEVFGPNRTFRIPAEQPFVYFFDIDGTLVDGSGKLSEDGRAAVRSLSQQCWIYLATSRPLQSARKVCSDIWDCISGGVFAEGADIQIFGRDYQKLIPLDIGSLNMDAAGIRIYRQEDIIYKVTMQSRSGWEYQMINQDKNHVVCEENFIGITNKDACKLNGILHICREMGYSEDRVAVIGNGHNDIDMLEYFNYSFAVQASDKLVLKAANYIRESAGQCIWRRDPLNI